jgi:hypothetical protein
MITLSTDIENLIRNKVEEIVSFENQVIPLGIPEFKDLSIYVGTEPAIVIKVIDIEKKIYVGTE